MAVETDMRTQTNILMSSMKVILHQHVSGLITRQCLHGAMARPFKCIRVQLQSFIFSNIKKTAT